MKTTQSVSHPNSLWVHSSLAESVVATMKGGRIKLPFIDILGYIRYSILFRLRIEDAINYVLLSVQKKAG